MRFWQGVFYNPVLTLCSLLSSSLLCSLSFSLSLSLSLSLTHTHTFSGYETLLTEQTSALKAQKIHWQGMFYMTVFVQNKIFHQVTSDEHHKVGPASAHPHVERFQGTRQGAMSGVVAIIYHNKGKQNDCPGQESIF